MTRTRQSPSSIPTNGYPTPDSEPPLARMSDLHDSPKAPRVLNLGCKVLQLLFTRDTRYYHSLIRHYFEVSQVCIVPRDFADKLLHSIVGADEEHCSCDMGRDAYLEIAKDISPSQTSKRPITDDRSSSSRFFDPFLGENLLYWDGIGILCALVASSAMLLPPNSKLLSNAKERDDLISDMAQASSLCVQLCFLRAPINGVMILLMYQNFMVISQLYGDTDRRIWMPLVDLVAAVKGSNLHKAETDADMPPYFVEMRRCLFAAVYSIEKTICTVRRNSPMLNLSSCTQEPPLDIELDVPGYQGTYPDVDAQGWSSFGQYCPMTWVRLHYFVSSMHERLLEATRSRSLDLEIFEINAVEDECVRTWMDLPDYLNYLHTPIDCHTDEQSNRSLLLATAYLDYLFVRLHANYKLRQYDLSYWLIQQMMITILDTNPRRRDGTSLPRGYSSIVVLYGVPAAHLLMRIRLLKDTVGGDAGTSWGETIRTLANFIERLDLVIEMQVGLKDQESDALQDARDKLVTNFDAIVDRSGAEKNEDGPIERAPWPPAYFDPFSFYVDLKDDIWRL